MKNSFKDNEYSVKIRVKPETLEWIKAHKGKKSAAGFLEELLDYIRNSNQFKKKK